MKNIEKYIVVGLFGALVTLCFLQIVFRSILNLSLSWTEELGRYVFILLVYMSACSAVLKDAHVKVEIIDSFVSGKARKHLETAMDLLFLGFMALIGYYGMLISIDAFELELLSPAMQTPMWLIYAIIPVTFFLTCIRLAQKVHQRYKTTEEGTEKFHGGAA